MQEAFLNHERLDETPHWLVGRVGRLRIRHGFLVLGGRSDYTYTSYLTTSWEEAPSEAWALITAAAVWRVHNDEPLFWASVNIVSGEAINQDCLEIPSPHRGPGPGSSLLPICGPQLRR